MQKQNNWKITVRPLANGTIRIRTQSPLAHHQAAKITECIERALMQMAATETAGA